MVGDELTGRPVARCSPRWIVGPFFRKIQRDERMAMTRYVGSEDADLAVRDLSGRTGDNANITALRLLTRP